MPINVFKGYTPKEEEIVEKADQLEEKLLSIVNVEGDNFVKFNAIIYLLNDFFVVEILKGKMDFTGVQRSLEEATKQMLGWIEKQTSGVRYVQRSV
jgi:hypothetical protein